MICQRCGTEFENEDGVCPRCYYGRVKVKKPLPKWVPWVLGVFGTLAVIGTVIGIFTATYFSSDWMDGSWEGSSLAITFNTEEGTFLLSNVETVLSGTFVASKDSFTLTAEDGNIYVYRYERKGNNKIQVMFLRDNETVRVTLNRQVGDFSDDSTEQPPEQ